MAEHPQSIHPLSYSHKGVLVAPRHMDSSMPGLSLQAAYRITNIRKCLRQMGKYIKDEVTGKGPVSLTSLL